MGNASERISNHVQSRALRAGRARPWEVEGLATVEREQTAYLPAVGQDRRSMLGAGDIVGPVPDKIVPSIEVAIPVIQFQIVAVQRNLPAILGHIIQGMRPGVGELSRQSVPRMQSENGLQGIVVGVAVAVELQD